MTDPIRIRCSFPPTATCFSSWWGGLLWCVLALATLPAAADEHQQDKVSAHLRAAESALQEHAYRAAAEEYRRAAALSSDPATARRATRVAFTYGFDELALDSALRWSKLDKKSDEALLYAAQLQLRLGQVRKSRANFRRILEWDGGEPDERLLDLVPILSREDPEDAYAVMRYLARPYRDSAVAHYAAGVMALQAGAHEEAAGSAREAMDLRPAWIKPKLLYARSLLLAGDTEEAIEYAARIVGDDPDPDPEARLELAILYMSAERDDDALSQVNQILLEQPARHDALRLMAIINFRQENLDAARADFEDLLASGRYTMDALYYLARIADYRDEVERALALYTQVNSGQHAVISQRRAAGIIADESGVERAMDHLQTFGHQNPHFAVDMTLAQAQLLASEDQLDEALVIYDRVLSYRPNDEDVVLGRAEVLLRNGQAEEAVAIYRKAVKRWPDSAVALNALGYTLTYYDDDYAYAARLIRKALRLRPDSAAIIDSHGWVLYRLGRNAEALSELQRAWEMMKDPEIALHLAEVLAVLERCDEAAAMLGEAESLEADAAMLQDVSEITGACGR